MKGELVGTASRPLWWFEASFVWWWWGEDTKGELADKASLAQWWSGEMVGVVVLGSPWGSLSA